MTYTAEKGADPNKTQRILVTAKMKIWRKLSNETLKDITINEGIRVRCRVEGINQSTINRKVE